MGIEETCDVIGYTRMPSHSQWLGSFESFASRAHHKNTIYRTYAYYYYLIQDKLSL
jgi:hypothetical protein